MNTTFPENAQTPAIAPVPAGFAMAQEEDVRSRVMFDIHRGRWVFERGAERLDVVIIHPTKFRVEVDRPEVLV